MIKKGFTMKKLIISLFFVFLFASVASAEEIQRGSVSQNVFEPQWSDICTYSAYWDIDINKDYVKAEKQYWKERRIQFNKEINYCRANSDKINLSDCYQAIIAVENDRTLKWTTTYADERKQRTIKTGGAVATLGILGITAAKLLDVFY